MHEFLLHSLTLCITSCFLCSAGYHIGRGAFPKQFAYWFTLDLVGIWLCVVGSFTTGIYIQWQCKAWIQRLYLIGFCLIVSVILCVWFVTPTIARWKTRQMGMVLVICIGSLAVLHWSIASPRDEFRVAWFGPCSLLWYCVGFTIMYKRFPERFYPGMFDIWFHSHQLWHICVGMGAITWWYALDHLVTFREHEQAAGRLCRDWL